MSLLIILLASSSYYMGVSSVLKGKYKPSIYSRALWFFLTINSFIGVYLLHNSVETLILASIQLIGSLAMFIVAWKYSIKQFGVIEIICTLLLFISVIIWILADSPIINLLISLIAFFIGGIPTIIQSIKFPESENFFFWFLFALASFISFFMADKSEFYNFIYSLYYFLFDSILTFLSSRQFLKQAILKK